ncbi:MAG: helix-turn-helix transcriptional regulator [candidate division KSB1 bacterium]|nr:helix-turn-helix transcriptional regulator [candidate division KSB1 bacterium]
MNQDCNCPKRRQARWLEASILYLLWEKPAHGYELMAALPHLGFMDQDADAGAVYRTLRHLEKFGYVISEWDTSGAGPAKRLYKLTKSGNEHLHVWRAIIQKRLKSLEAFAEKLNQLKGEHDENSDTMPKQAKGYVD